MILEISDDIAYLAKQKIECECGQTLGADDMSMRCPDCENRIFNPLIDRNISRGFRRAEITLFRYSQINRYIREGGE